MNPPESASILLDNSRCIRCSTVETRLGTRFSALLVAAYTVYGLSSARVFARAHRRRHTARVLVHAEVIAKCRDAHIRPIYGMLQNDTIASPQGGDYDLA